MRIVLHIERLVFDGFTLTSRERGAVQRALSTELSRLLATGLHPDVMSGGSRATMTAPRLELNHDAAPVRLGTQLAGAVHAVIGRPPQPVSRHSPLPDVAGRSGSRLTP